MLIEPFNLLAIYTTLKNSKNIFVAATISFMKMNVLVTLLYIFLPKFN